MTYAKLVNGKPEYAPRRIIYEGMQVFNPSGEKLLALGYKPVVYTEPPETEPGFIAVPGWTETEEDIVQTWTVEEEPDEVDSDRAMEILFEEGE